MAASPNFKIPVREFESKLLINFKRGFIITYYVLNAKVTNYTKTY